MYQMYEERIAKETELQLLGSVHYLHDMGVGEIEGDYVTFFVQGWGPGHVTFPSSNFRAAIFMQYW